MFEALSCQDCGGGGIDLGSLNEPEPCVSCNGSGRQWVQMDPRVCNYGERKPMGRALPNPITMSEIEERRGRYVD